MSDQEDGAPSDADLLRSHVEGDRDAFGVLFARHRDRLWAVALRTMGNPDDAADGLQDGLVAAYRRAGSFRGEAAVTTWLHRVVVNACLDRLRAAKVRRAEALPDDLEEYGGRGSTVTADVADPADLAVLDERRRRVLAALAELPAEQRAALVLVDMEGYPVSEVARMLDCAEGTVKSRCSRGRARLAEALHLLAPGGDPDHAAPGNPPPGPGVRSTRAPRAPPAG
ncbi:RNA polymerase sigma factor SigM [Nocardioides sp. cx-173]|uniref:RNA polymerase sigma factor SigM n=1 Tax=Nocardioides sp. cx-173 TaxID=2898796 RepID=UPI001E4C6654|nr:RNA polymerase sigma factor SigM [Nocardioides sp. cx-173]MCD4523746.1 RNA polymerase sigma factor SigM [Nocardioides sp. cx-173]UGB41928.1 RNA polymerase sigma factor SigM [Nocardioides sp. cx-173]